MQYTTIPDDQVTEQMCEEEIARWAAVLARLRARRQRERDRITDADYIRRLWRQAQREREEGER